MRAIVVRDQIDKVPDEIRLPVRVLQGRNAAGQRRQRQHERPGQQARNFQTVGKPLVAGEQRLYASKIRRDDKPAFLVQHMTGRLTHGELLAERISEIEALGKFVAQSNDGHFEIRADFQNLDEPFRQQQ